MYGFGFGLDVPLMKFGTQSVIGSPAAVNDGKCGDSFALQQMLADLGVYSGTVDGAIGSGTMTALRKFSEVTGVPYDKGTFPKATVCQAVMDTWAAKMAPPPPAAASTASPTMAGGVKFQRFAAKAFVARSAADSARATGAGARGGDVTVAGEGSWWASLSGGAQLAIVGGGLAAVGAVAYLMLGRKRAAPNPRRRARKKIAASTTIAAIIAMLDDEGYALAAREAHPDLSPDKAMRTTALEIRRAARAGALLWTFARIVTTDASRLDMRSASGRRLPDADWEGAEEALVDLYQHRPTRRNSR
jgi:hypothetical protein